MAADIESKEWLVRHISLVPPWLTMLGAVNLPGIDIKTRDSPAGSISNTLARRARRRALVIAVDEAHTLAVEVGRALLQGVQQARSDGVPVMLLLVGRPELSRHLSQMEVSSCDRNKMIPLGRLSSKAAAEAIRIPTEAEGYGISPEALAQVATEGHGYPLFVQMWGRSLWNARADGTRPMSLDDVDRARPRFEAARDRYYGDRFSELKRAKLPLVAAKLSLAFIDNDKLTDLEVDEPIRESLHSEGGGSDRDSVMAARERLQDLGYIWSAVDESRPSYQPGIPGLMQYVAQRGNLNADSEAE